VSLAATFHFILFRKILADYFGQNVKRSEQNEEFNLMYRDADKSLARPGRKQATATEDFEFRISYL
jgi:hypothetical protein